MSNPYISLILSSRIKGNKNSKLLECLRGFADKAENKDSFEVLIKFDDDDEDAAKLNEEVKKLPIKVRTITTPRGKGYADLHKAYLDLFVLAAPSSKLFWVISDDLEIFSQNWDQALIEAYKKSGEKTAVLHANKLKNMATLTYMSSVEKVDCYPIWSRKWLCSAGFGYSFSTDGWTGIIEFLVFTNHNIDNRIVVENLKYERHIDPEIDSATSPRWINERQKLLDMVASDNFRNIAAETAATVAAKINKEGKKRVSSLLGVRQLIYKNFMDKKTA